MIFYNNRCNNWEKYELYLNYLLNNNFCTPTDIDECSNHPCRNNGTCKNEIADFICDCVGEWKGRTCASVITHCDSNTCQNDGTCVDQGDKFNCRCKAGWTGRTCRIRKYNNVLIHCNGTFVLNF